MSAPTQAAVTPWEPAGNLHRPAGFHGARCQPFLPRPGSQRAFPAQELEAAAKAAANHERLCFQRNVLALEKSQRRPRPPPHPGRCRRPSSHPRIGTKRGKCPPGLATREGGWASGVFSVPAKGGRRWHAGPPTGSRFTAPKRSVPFSTTFLLLLFWPGIAGLQNSLHSCQPCRSRSLIPFFKKKNQDQGRASPAQKGPPAPCCAVSGSVAEASRGDGMEGEMVSSSKGIGVGIPCFPLPPQGHTGARWRSADHMGTCGRAKSPLR